MHNSSLGYAIAISSTSMAATAIAALAYRALSNNPKSSKKHVLDKLPPNLDTWRQPGKSHEAEEKIWQDLDEVLRDGGFTQWPHRFMCTQISPNKTYPSPGYSHAIRIRETPESHLNTASTLRRFNYSNPLNRAVRTREGHDAIMRIIVIKDEGQRHLDILRKLATGPENLLSSNHTLPMLNEFRFEHFTFGIFPKVGGNMHEAYNYWAQNSVGDVLDMVMQALEGLAFIHSLNVAHRDAFKNNFLVQWHPESMRAMAVTVSRPRVYLIDFEVAIEFPPECPAGELVCTGYPLGGSFSQPEMYSRQQIPEMKTGEPYDPFKLDVWQLGTSLANFKSTIEPIDGILTRMASNDPASRMDANEALSRLRAVVHSMSPQSLLIPPTVIEDDD